MTQNPFTLTFGKEPDTLINRYQDVENIIYTLSSISRTYLIEGVRGSGKTVLMTTIANRLAKDSAWVVINLNSAFDLLEEMARRLYRACNAEPGLFDRGFSVSFVGFGVGVNGKESLPDVVGMIEDLLTDLKKQNRKVLITIDEVLPDANMRVFASQFQICLREDYPVYLIMTGLHENIHAIQNDPSLTFLLRTPKTNLEPLRLLSVMNCYRSVLQISSDEAENMARLTKGYAFAFQALGVIYWENRNKPDWNVIIPKLDEMLDDFVYSKIWTTLSKREKELLLAVERDEVATAEVCDRIGMKSNSYSKYKKSLEEKGLIRTVNRGCISLALPRFREIAVKYDA